MPNPPAVDQCQYRHDKGAFFCVNTETKARVKIPLADPRMKGAQCLPANDYKKSEAWVNSVIDIAKQRCN